MSDPGDETPETEEGETDRQSRPGRALQYVLDLVDLVVDLF